MASALSASIQEDVVRFLDLVPEYCSVAGTQTECSSTVGFDVSVDEPVKWADSKVIEKSLRRAASHDAVKALKGMDEVAWLALEPTNRASIGAAEGVDVILNSMQRWMGKKSAVQHTALTALARLLTEPMNVEAFYSYASALLQKMEAESGYKGGGTLLVAAAMSGYPLKTDIQKEGCAVARALSNDEVHQARFLAH
ncbi:hypothetical protein DIPPA_70139a, partial [Diplonema papillatum]